MNNKQRKLNDIRLKNRYRKYPLLTQTMHYAYLMALENMFKEIHENEDSKNHESQH